MNMDINQAIQFIEQELPDVEQSDTEVAKSLSRRKVSFDPRLAFELALREEPVDVVLARYDVSKRDFARLKKHKPFLKALKSFHDQLKESGVSFKLKAQLLADDLLEEGYLIARNPEVPSSSRVKMIEDIVRWAEYEPKKESENNDGSMFNIQINL